MTPAQALRELLDVSEDLVAAVVFGRDGEVAAATVDDARARTAAQLAGAMLSYADALRAGASARSVEAVAAERGVFVVQDGDRVIVGVTGPEPASGLVQHDLRECLGKSAQTREAVGAAT